MRRLLLALVLAAVPAAAYPAVESAVASMPRRAYSSGTVATLEGEGLRLVQLDPLERHDVVALDGDPETGEPLFGNSEPLRFGETDSVAGVALLPPGAYPFACSIHEEMQGLLLVQDV